MISTTTMGDSYKQLGTVRRCPVRLASAAPRDQPMTPPSAWPASVFASSGPWLAGSSAGPDGWRHSAWPRSPSPWSWSPTWRPRRAPPAIRSPRQPRAHQEARR